MSTGRRLDRLEAALAPQCPGPRIEIREGTRAELDAMPLPACPCGGAHPGLITFIEVVRPEVAS